MQREGEGGVYKWTGDGFRPSRRRTRGAGHMCEREPGIHSLCSVGRSYSGLRAPWDQLHARHLAEPYCHIHLSKGGGIVEGKLTVKRGLLGGRVRSRGTNAARSILCCGWQGLLQKERRIERCMRRGRVETGEMNPMEKLRNKGGVDGGMHLRHRGPHLDPRVWLNKSTFRFHGGSSAGSIDPDTAPHPRP